MLRHAPAPHPGLLGDLFPHLVATMSRSTEHIAVGTVQGRWVGCPGCCSCAVAAAAWVCRCLGCMRPNIYACSARHPHDPPCPPRLTRHVNPGRPACLQVGMRIALSCLPLPAHPRDSPTRSPSHLPTPSCRWACALRCPACCLAELTSWQCTAEAWCRCGAVRLFCIAC